MPGYKMIRKFCEMFLLSKSNSAIHEVFNKLLE